MVADAFKGDGSALLGRGRFLFAVFIFLLLFWYPWNTEKNPLGQDFVMRPDSDSYVLFQAWRDPWLSLRSIGYPAILYPFLYPNQNAYRKVLRDIRNTGMNLGDPESRRYSAVEKAGLSKKLERVVFLQRTVLALAISLFYLAFCRWFPPLFSFGALLGALWVAPPPCPQWILTEPLSNACTWFCAAFLLLAPKGRHRHICVALACLSAACAYLIRPQAISVTAVCSLVFLYEVFVWLKQRVPVRVFFKSALSFAPLLITYGYIAWLSITAGQLFLHTHYPVYYAIFGELAEAEDVPFMPTERAKKFTARFGEYKDDFLKKLEAGEGPYAPYAAGIRNSPAHRSIAIGRAFNFVFSKEMMWNHFEDLKKLSNKQRNIFGKELTSGLRQRHKYEMVSRNWHNFIGGLGSYPGVWRLRLFPRTTFAINMTALLLTASALVICVKARWPVVLLTGVHLLAILTAAMGHFVIARYVEPTEVFLLLAGLGSLWALGVQTYDRFRGGTTGAPASVTG